MHPNLPNRETQAKREPSPEVSSMIADLESRTDKSDPNQRFYLVMLKRYRKQFEEYIQKQFEGKTENELYLRLIGSVINQYGQDDVKTFIESHPEFKAICEDEKLAHLTIKEILSLYLMQNNLIHCENICGIPYLSVPGHLIPKTNNAQAYCSGLSMNFKGMVFFETDDLTQDGIDKTFKHEITHVVFEALNNSGIIDLQKNYTEPNEEKRGLMYRFTHEFLAYNSDEDNTRHIMPVANFGFNMSQEPINEIHKIFLDELKKDINRSCYVWSEVFTMAKKQGTLNRLKHYLLTEVKVWDDVALADKAKMFKVMNIAAGINTPTSSHSPNTIDVPAP